MEDSDWSNQVKTFFHRDNYIQSFKFFSTAFTCDNPNGGIHIALLPDPVFKFLRHYFLDIVKEVPLIFTERDIVESSESSTFKDIFYFVWKYLQHFQEIYWNKNYSFNIEQELGFGSTSAHLKEQMGTNSCCLINLGNVPLTVGDGLELPPNHLGILFNSPLVHIEEFKDIHYLYFSLF